MAIYAKGSTIIHLHYKDIAKAQLLLPDLCEQDRIAKCMMAEDEKNQSWRTTYDQIRRAEAVSASQMFIWTSGEANIVFDKWTFLKYAVLFLF